MMNYGGQKRKKTPKVSFVGGGLTTSRYLITQIWLLPSGPDQLI